MQKLWLRLTIIIVLMPMHSYAQNFFDQRYRGWLWFEEKAQDESKDKDFMQEQKSSYLPSEEEIAKAKLDNEKFTEELEGLRHLIIRYPDNLEFIRLYKEKEKEMLDRAMILASNFAMVNFLRPDIADQLKNPQNIYGRNVAKSEKEKQDRESIKSLTAKVELFVFRQDSCSHCLILEKHLSSFAKKYGFKVEAVSQDNSASHYFKTHNNPQIIKKLALTVMPTVIAVTKDSSQRFELARGAVSIPDLEDKALLLAKFLDSKELNNQHLINRQR